MATSSNKKVKLDDARVPNDFFDSAKEDIKKQELEKELDLFKKQLEVIEVNTNETINQELEVLQKSKNLDELDDQIYRLQKVIEMERRTEKCLESLNAKQKHTKNRDGTLPTSSKDDDYASDHSNEEDDIDDIFNDWRSRNAISKVSR